MERGAYKNMKTNVLFLHFFNEIRRQTCYNAKCESVFLFADLTGRVEGYLIRKDEK